MMASPLHSQPAELPVKLRPFRGRNRSHDRIQEPPVAATMYVSNSGGGIRRLIGGAHRHVIAMRRDPQVRFGQPTEGIAEGPAMMAVAVNPDVSYYQSQPFRLEFMFNGRLHSWIADLLYVENGTIFVCEIKRSLADLYKPEYLAKLHFARLLLEQLGWFFKIWTLENILGSTVRQVNVATIYFDRAACLDELLPRFDHVAASRSKITYGELIRELDPLNNNRARAAVHRLIMLGRVWVDLDQLIEDWSRLELRPDRSHVVPAPFQ